MYKKQLRRLKQAVSVKHTVGNISVGVEEVLRRQLCGTPTISLVQTLRLEIHNGFLECKIDWEA